MKGGLREIFWMLLPFFCLALPHLVRNHLLYGNLTGLNAAMNPLALKGENSVFLAVSSIQASFWATAGRYNEISFYYPAPGVIFSYLAIFGLLRDYFRKSKPLLTLIRDPLGIAFIETFLLLLFIDFLYGYYLQEGQGRFLFHFLFGSVVLC